MRLLRSFPLMCFALVLLSIVGVCVAQQSVGFLLLAGTLAVISWYVTEGPRGRHLPRWVSNVLIVAVSLNVFIELMNAQEVMGVLGRFVVWLTLIKLYERKTPRDYGHLLALSLMLMIIGCVVSTELLFGVVLVLYAVVGLYVLLLYQLHAQYERMREQRRLAVPEGYRLAPTLRPIIGRSASGQFRGLFAGIALVGLASSILIFVVMPRTVPPWLGSQWSERLADRGRVETGFNETVDLRTAARTTSRRTVMEVQVRDPSGRPIHFDRPLLLRGAVQNTVDSEGRWVSSRSRRHRTRGGSVPGGKQATIGRVDPSELHLYTQDVTVFSPMDRVFSMWVPVALEMERSERLALDGWALTIESEEGGGLNSRRYTVQADRAPSAALMQQMQRRRSASWPSSGRFPDDERIRRHAEQVLRDGGVSPEPPGDGLAHRRGRDVDEDDAQRRWRWNRQAALAMMRYLRSEKFQYSDDLSGVQVRTDLDPQTAQVTSFLFDHHKGDCNYFAASMAAMCHNLDIHARLVTGFVGYEYNESDQAYIIRQSNAHTWVEVRVGPQQWATFDPTPPAELEQAHGGTGHGVADQLRWYYDRFEFSWRSEVVQFDRDAQETIAESVRGNWSETLTGLGDRFTRWMRDFNRMFAVGMAGYIWLATAAVLIVLWLFVLAWLVRRLGRLRRALGLPTLHSTEAMRLLRQAGFYLDMLAVLERAGFRKPAWQPPQAYGRVVAARHPEAGGLVERITMLFYAARFGGRRLTDEEAAEARRLVERLDATLRAGG